MSRRPTPSANKKDVEFVVTGFGPFHDAVINPTKSLVQNLVPYLETREAEAVTGDDMDDACDGGVSSLLLSSAVKRTLVIETSAQAAREEIAKLYSDLTCTGIGKGEREGGGSATSNGEGEGSSSSTTRTVIIILHLGVNYKGTKFQLESCAYNEASFGVPDERGDQPQQEAILEQRELGAPLLTDFDVPTLVEHTQKSCVFVSEEEEEQKEVIVVESTDPGRFVCNFTYYLSLDKCTKLNGNTDESRRFWCLFLHVPPFDVIPEQEQLAFLARLMEQLRVQARCQITT